MADVDIYRQALRLPVEGEKVPPLIEKPEPPPQAIPIVPQPVDPYREALGLSTSPMYERGKGPIPPAQELDDPNLSLLRLLASSDDPIAEISRINATQYIAHTFDLDPGVTYSNLESLSQYWLGKIAPPEVFAQSLRDAWDNGMQNYELAKLALRLRETGGTDEALLTEIGELEASIKPLKDIPRPWIQNAMLWAMESSPLMAQAFLHGGIMGAATGATAGLALAASPPGLVAAGITEGMSVPAITLAMASVGFVVGSTQDMIQVMRGLAYWRMLKDGVPHNVAGPLSDIEGVIEGAIESLGNILIGLKIPGLTPALKSAGQLISNKILASGVVGVIATRIASQAVGAALGEGIEEPLQELTAIFTDQLARELTKNKELVAAFGREQVQPTATIPPITFQQAIERTGQAFFTGMSAGLVFGVVGAPGGARADVSQLSNVKQVAAQSPTRLGFIENVIRNDLLPEVAGVSEARWREYLGKVWDQQHPGKAPPATGPAVTIPEGVPQPAITPARGPEGRIYTETEERTRTREGVTAILKAGDPATGQRFGYVAYETVGNRIYIEDVVNESETDIRRELVLDLAARFPGQEIEWNPTDPLDVALQQDLIATNPRGPENGLQWFEGVAPAAQKELTRGLFVERMGELFAAETPQQAELFGKLADTFARVAGLSTEEWLKQYVAPEVTAKTEETEAQLAEAGGVASTRFMIEGRAISPLAVDVEQFKGQVRAVFTALGKADFHHGVHEFFHAVERLALSPEQIKNFETALGKLRETWTTEDVEKLADYFEDYLATGKAPTEELRSVFQQIAAALKALVSFIKERLGGEPRFLSPEFEKAYDALFAKPDSGLAQVREEAPPAAPIAEGQVEDGVEPSAEEAVTIIHPSAVPPEEVALDRITLSAEVPNFKEMADKRGIIEPLLADEYVRVGIPPVVLWERTDGRLEIITGRHRLDLAQRLTLPTILSQIVREAEGFTAAMAMTFDAESNIRDGQGSVRDYANYFKNSEITEQEASRRGLLDRHKGRTGYAIGRYAADGLYSLYRNNKISEAKAAAIAAASLGDERLQGLGITRSKQLSADELGNFISLARQQVTTSAGVQSDMFGFDDSLIREGEKVAKAVSAKKAELLQERQALSSALRLSKGAQAKIVEKYGFKSGDVAAIQDRVDVLGAELTSWENWTQDPEKMREARQLAGLPVKELLHPEGEEPPFQLEAWDDKLLRPKEEPATQPIFEFAEERELLLKDWTKTKEGWQHVSGKIADKALAIELTHLKDLEENLSLFHRDKALEDEFNKAAVKIFGVTDNPEHGAWILSDGRMLNFDWNKHGGARYYGRIYHVEIGRVFKAIDPKKRRYNKGAYSDAWKAGAVRIDTTHNGEISIASTMIPTNQQLRTIEDAMIGQKTLFLEIVGTDIDERTIGFERLEDPETRDVRRFYAKMSQKIPREKALFHKMEAVGDLNLHYGDELQPDVFLHGSGVTLDIDTEFLNERTAGGTLFFTKNWDVAMRFAEQEEQNIGVARVDLEHSIDLSKEEDRNRLAELLVDEVPFYDGMDAAQVAKGLASVDLVEGGLIEGDGAVANALYDHDIWAVVDNQRSRNVEVLSPEALKPLQAGKDASALFHPAPPVNSEAFKEWFGDSKVVGPDGTPKLMYHGTKAGRFEVFRAGDLGIHFGTIDQAQWRAGIATFVDAEGRIRAPSLYPVYVRLQNPLRLQDRGGWSSEEVIPQLINLGIITQTEGDSIPTRAKTLRDKLGIIRSLLKNKGYDGIIYLNRYEGVKDLSAGADSKNLSDGEFKSQNPEAEDSVMVLDPEQVKSVYNRGTWSALQASILFHPADWQEEFLYGTRIDAEIYSQYVELAKGYESAEAFRADMEEKYGEPGEADIAGEAATRFYQETWNEAQSPTAEPEAPPTVPIESPVIPSAAVYDYQEKVDVSREIEDPKIAAQIEAGEISEADLDKLMVDYTVVSHDLEKAKKNLAGQRAARKLRDVRRKLIAHIMRPPGRNIQYRGYAEQIRLIQQGLDPTMREYRIKNGVQIMEKTRKGYAREQTRKFFEENPEAAAQVPKEKLDRFYSVNLPDMTIAQMEEIADSIDILRKLGSLKRHLELVQRAKALTEMRNRMVGSVLRGQEPKKPIGGVKPTGKALKTWIATLKPSRVLALLDGVFAGVKEGPFTELGYDRVNQAWNAFKKSDRQRKAPVMAKMEKLGFTLDPLEQIKGKQWVKRKIDIDGFKYTNGKMPTLEDVMFWYIGMKNERTAAALMYGNNLSEGLSGQVITKGIAMLSEKERAMAEAIEEDGNKNFGRLRDAFIDIFNMDLPGEEHYIPMIRKEVSYETREEQVAAELTARAGVRKQFIARHPTFQRIDIADEHQKPIRTDLFGVWSEGVTIQEGFIHQYSLIKEMHDTFESDQVRAAVQQKYGPDLNRWLKKYTNDLAQADAYTNLKGLERLSRTARAHATAAWLGFNMLTVLKQTVGVFGYIADLGPLAPAYLLEASAKLAAGSVKSAAGGHFIQNTQIDFVKERSEFVRNRQISVDLENLKHIRPGLYNAIIGKIGKWGMKGLEVMDITTVCIGWTAVYDKVLHETQNEATAIEAADAATMRTQPSARVQDMAEIYRQGEVLKWFTIFTSELSAIWNRLSFDVPLALRRKEFIRAMGDLTSFAIAGVVIAIASGALQGDDEEKKKKLMLGILSEYVESIPIFGNDIFSYISGKQFQSSGVKLVPAVTMIMETGKQITEADWDSALKNGLEALSFAVGLPYSQPRRIIRALYEKDANAILGWPKGTK